jgi:hypothetical protein
VSKSATFLAPLIDIQTSDTKGMSEQDLKAVSLELSHENGVSLKKQTNASEGINRAQLL